MNPLGYCQLFEKYGYLNNYFFIGPSPAKTEAAPENDNLKTPPKKVDLKTYYKNQGTSLSQVRRMNRNYIRHDGPSSEADGVVFWDSYSPPPGYTGMKF